MGTDHRAHERHRVRLSVSYTNATEFVTDYVENLSIGGLFIAGAHQLAVDQQTEVRITLPQHGTWRVRAQVVFIYSKEQAAQTGRRAGAGLQITHKPRGFDDALFGYLIRLGRRREVCVMAGDVEGRHEIVDTGYQVIPLVESEALQQAIEAAPVPIIAVVVPRSRFAIYDARARISGVDGIVFGIASLDDVADVLARIDALL